MVRSMMFGVLLAAIAMLGCAALDAKAGAVEQVAISDALCVENELLSKPDADVGTVVADCALRETPAIVALIEGERATARAYRAMYLRDARARGLNPSSLRDERGESAGGAARGDVLAPRDLNLPSLVPEAPALRLRADDEQARGLALAAALVLQERDEVVVGVQDHVHVARLHDAALLAQAVLDVAVLEDEADGPLPRVVVHPVDVGPVEAVEVHAARGEDGPGVRVAVLVPGRAAVGHRRRAEEVLAREVRAPALAIRDDADVARHGFQELARDRQGERHAAAYAACPRSGR